jgi:hypothetical protein
MKNPFQLFTTLITFATLAGCAGNAELVKKMSVSTNMNIFQEIDEHSQPVPGYVDLRVHSSLKTHKPGIYSNKDIHGTQEYILLVNIDGQATALTGCMNEERSETRSIRDPEEGEGIRYQFTKKLRVKTGAHRVVVALPADNLVAESEVILSEGQSNSLTIEPAYGSIPGKQRPGAYTFTRFKEGIRSIRLLLNGETI